MNCQSCNQVIATYVDYLMGNCPEDKWFGHKLTAGEANTLRLQRPPEKPEKKEEVAP